ANRRGGFVEGAVTRLAWGENTYQLARHTPNILVNGNSVLVTWDEQARPWFECPVCGRRCKHLYLDPLACRVCCRLDYASRHLHRQVPGVHRVMRWRRMIGIDPHPFAAIPKRPRHHTRFHRIVAQMRIIFDSRSPRWCTRSAACLTTSVAMSPPKLTSTTTSSASKSSWQRTTASPHCAGLPIVVRSASTAKRPSWSNAEATMPTSSPPPDGSTPMVTCSIMSSGTSLWINQSSLNSAFMG